jgi:hypothetical protein
MWNAIVWSKGYNFSGNLPLKTPTFTCKKKILRLNLVYFFRFFVQIGLLLFCSNPCLALFVQMCSVKCHRENNNFCVIWNKTDIWIHFIIVPENKNKNLINYSKSYLKYSPLCPIPKWVENPNICPTSNLRSLIKTGFVGFRKNDCALFTFRLLVRWRSIWLERRDWFWFGEFKLW